MWLSTRLSNRLWGPGDGAPSRPPERRFELNSGWSGVEATPGIEPRIAVLQPDAAARGELAPPAWSLMEQGKRRMGDRQWARLFLAAGLADPPKSQIAAICEELDAAQRERQEAAEKAIALAELLRSELHAIPGPATRRP